LEITLLSDKEYTVSDLLIKNIHTKRFCVFDFEATGINHETEHITQIGAVIVENNEIVESRTVKTYVKPLKPIPESVERFTGIYNTDLIGAPSLAAVYDQFVKFTEGCILVTHAGYEFDLPLLKNECKRSNLSMITAPCVDTKALFSYLHPEIEDIIWTDYLIKHYNVNDKDLKRHDALGDSILIARIFLRILNEFKNRNIEDVDFIKPVIVKRFQIKPLV
jgi:DNA polymerase-3 subunit epsilon